MPVLFDLLDADDMTPTQDMTDPTLHIHDAYPPREKLSKSVALMRQNGMSQDVAFLAASTDGMRGNCHQERLVRNGRWFGDVYAADPACLTWSETNAGDVVDRTLHR